MVTGVSVVAVWREVSQPIARSRLPQYDAKGRKTLTTSRVVDAVSSKLVVSVTETVCVGFAIKLRVL